MPAVLLYPIAHKREHCCIYLQDASILVAPVSILGQWKVYAGS
jgi:hypothetical protein